MVSNRKPAKPRHSTRKQLCSCGHVLSIHHRNSQGERPVFECWFPNCKCKDYKPAPQP